MYFLNLCLKELFSIYDLQIEQEVESSQNVVIEPFESNLVPVNLFNGLACHPKVVLCREESDFLKPLILIPCKFLNKNLYKYLLPIHSI